MIAHSFPVYFEMIGSVVSIAVAPPEAIPASLPKYLTKIGTASKVIISRKMLESRAITPSVSPLIWVMKIEDKL